jgi:DNA-binding beta-propeller fold protein YncE
MARFETSAMLRRATAAVVVLALAGCASTGSLPSEAAQGAAATQATSTPTPTTTAWSVPSAADPTPIVAPSMAIEPSLATVWEKAGPAKGRKWTWSPEVDPKGRIWAAASFDNLFWIFDRDGKYLESWGTPGNGDGQVTLSAEGNGYGDIAFDANGGFYVADAGNSRIQQFDKDRRFVKFWGSFGTAEGQFTIPIDIATDAAGHVYVIDDGRHDVQEFDADGMFVRIAATNVGPYFDVDANGNVIAVDNEGSTVILQSFARDGSRSWAIDLRPVITFATGIDVLPSGEIFVASSTGGSAVFEYENLLELDSTGKLLHTWPNGAEGIAVDPKGGRIYQTFSEETPVVRALTLPAK